MADLDQLKARWAVVQQLLEELEEMTSALGEVAFDDDWKIACIELGIDHTMEPHRAVRQWAAAQGPVVRTGTTPELTTLLVICPKCGRPMQLARTESNNPAGSAMWAFSCDEHRPITRHVVRWERHHE